MTVSPVLDERFRAAAAAAELLDVAFDVVPDTPVGPLLIGVTDHGVCRISFDADPEHHLDFNRLMEDKASDPSAWPDPFRRDPADPPHLIEIAPGHSIEATASPVSMTIRATDRARA